MPSELATTEAEDIVRIAERCYWMDAQFHAEVERAVLVLHEDLGIKTGQRMTDADLSLARIAASVALVVKEQLDA